MTPNFSDDSDEIFPRIFYPGIIFRGLFIWGFFFRETFSRRPFLRGTFIRGFFSAYQIVYQKMSYSIKVGYKIKDLETNQLDMCQIFHSS